MTEPRGRGALRTADAEARRLAQEVFDRPFVLEAGAGTGKTTALIARLTAWCMGPGWDLAASRLATDGREAEPDPETVAARVLDGIVAITFTEAAAAEMAERAAASLSRLAEGELPEGLAGDRLPTAPDRRARRARALLGQLDHLGVRTIHAFCRRVLAAFPLEAGLHPAFEVDADGSRRSELVRETVASALTRGYGQPGDPDWLALAEEEHGPEQVETALLAMLDAGVPVEALERDPFGPEPLAALRDAFRARVTEFLAVEGGRFPAGGSSPNSIAAIAAVHRAAARLGAPGSDATPGFSELQEIAVELGEAAGDRLAEWAKGKLNKTDLKYLGEVQDELVAAAAAIVALLGHLPHVDARQIGHWRRVLCPLLAEVRTRLRASGVVGFGDLLRHARALLESRPDVRLRLRRGIDQVFVDEFQDTDAIQCAIVRALALDGDPEERPGLFLVGDPKQSIYAWRSADLMAYDAFIAEVLAAGGERHRLSVNHRSVPAVLDEVERVIRPVMREEPGVQPAFEPLIASPRLAADAGFTSDGRAPVEHWVSWRRDPATGVLAARTRSDEATGIEAEAVARDILEIHLGHGVPWQEFGLLLRSRGSLETYLDALRRAGVPYAVGKDRSYYQRREIVEATALVRAILDPHDHVALVAWLRSPVVGVPDAALPGLWARELPRLLTSLDRPLPPLLAEIGAAIDAAARELPADIPGLDRVAGWERLLAAGIEALATLRQSYQLEAPDRFVERLRALTLIEATEAARWLGHYRTANLDRFFRELAAALSEPDADPRAVLRTLRVAIAEAREADEARPREALENAVQVMTIHEAKGLDFAQVYLLQTHRGSGRGRRKECAAGSIGERWELDLFDARTPGFHEIEQRREAAESAERVRTLYVALTRAERRLVVAGCWPRAAEAMDPEDASRHADLVAQREGGRPDLVALGNAAGSGGPWSVVADHAIWRFPQFRPEADRPRIEAAERPTLPSIRQVRRDAETLVQARESARARMARSWSAPASEAAHQALRDEIESDALEDDALEEERRRGPRTRPRDAAVARAIGTALHRALETWDLAATTGTELQRQRDLIAATLGPLVPAAEHPAAVRGATALLERVAAGPLLARLVALAPDILARELPLLLPPAAGDSAPVGYIAGAADLVYRDPATAEVVVADYKTDVVASEAELEQRRRAYSLQGAVYVRAVQEALGLARAPRFELWFLADGRVVTVG